MEVPDFIKNLSDKLRDHQFICSLDLRGMLPVMIVILEGIRDYDNDESVTKQIAYFYLYLKKRCIEAEPDTEEDFDALEKAIGVELSIEDSSL